MTTWKRLLTDTKDVEKSFLWCPLFTPRHKLLINSKLSWDTSLLAYFCLPCSVDTPFTCFPEAIQYQPTKNKSQEAIYGNFLEALFGDKDCESPSQQTKGLIQLSLFKTKSQK